MISGLMASRIRRHCFLKLLSPQLFEILFPRNLCPKKMRSAELVKSACKQNTRDFFMNSRPKDGSSIFQPVAAFS